MTTITIDNVEYDLNSLSDGARSQIQMIEIADQEIRRLAAQTAIAQTARNAYAKALKEALMQSGDAIGLGD